MGRRCPWVLWTFAAAVAVVPGCHCGWDGSCQCDCEAPFGPDDAGGPDTRPGEAGTCISDSPVALFAVSRLDVGREGPEGTTPGLNLDGRVSDDWDPQGCFQPDFISPEGVVGVDGQLALMLPELEGDSPGAITEALADTVARGEVLLLLRIDSLDSSVNDDCVDLTVHRASLLDSVPATEDDGSLSPGQTFILGPPLLEMPGGRVRSGRFEAAAGTSFDLDLPGTTLGTLPLRVREPRIALHLAPDISGRMAGTLGGGLNVQELTALRSGLENPEGLAELRSSAEAFADLDPDASDICQAVSAAFTFEVVEAEGAILVEP